MKKLVLTVAFAAAIVFSASSAMAVSPCCDEATDGSSCQATEPGSLSGCIDGDGATTCAGGTLDPDAGGPAGCICVGGECTSEACTDDAAAACCAAGVGNDCPE